MKTVLSVFGTRPEAIKMAPLLRAMSVSKEIRSIVCVTGQHRTMLQQVLELFGIHADYNLDVMVPDQSLSGLSARIMGELDPVLQTVRPDIVLVHGDTPRPWPHRSQRFTAAWMWGMLKRVCELTTCRSPGPKK